MSKIGKEYKCSNCGEWLHGRAVQHECAPRAELHSRKRAFYIVAAAAITALVVGTGALLFVMGYWG